MNRLEEVTAKRTVLEAQLRAHDIKIAVLKQIEKLTFADISSININFSDGTLTVLQLKEEKDELKDAILEILEERIKNE